MKMLNSKIGQESKVQKSDVSQKISLTSRALLNSSVKLVRVIYYLALVIILVLGQVAKADFNQLVKDIFPTGTMVNSTSAAMVKEQAAGHLMGGSLVVKGPANPKLQLLRAQAPSCKLGGLPCGAQIELFGGSISAISGEELMQYLRSIPGNAMTYGAMMAVKTLCSQCHQILEYLDGKADFLNQFNLDSCSMMQGIMDPMFAKAQAKMQALKQSDMLLTGQCSDMAQCQSESKSISDQKEPQSKELKSQLGDRYNLVWKALGKKGATNSGSRTSQELKELLMSISGTIIGNKDIGGRLSVRHIKSLVNRDLIRQFIGSEAKEVSLLKLYRCDEPEYCLKPEIKTVRARPEMFLFQRVKKILESISGKILKNAGTLTVEEETLIALSSEQLILKIEMDLATYTNRLNVVNNQHEYIEALSYDVITNYLQGLLVEVQQAVGELSHSQMADADKFESFAQESREIMRQLAGARREARGRYDLIMKTKMRTKRELEYFQREFESFVDNAN